MEVRTSHRFYVSGGTGYSDHFRPISDRLGPFDLSFIKIGAYRPGAPWLDIHMSAEDAVRAHGELRASRVELLTPRVGEIIDADQAFPFNAWWEAVH